MKVLQGFAAWLVIACLTAALAPLGLLVTLNATVMNPQFMVKEIDKLDLVTLTSDVLEKQLPADVKPYKAPIIATLEQNQGWIKQQADIAVQESYRYLLKQSNDWSVKINIEPLKTSLINNIVAFLDKTPPADYARLNQAEKKQFVADLKDQINTIVSSDLQLTKADIPAEALPQIEKARRAMALIKTVYYSLIGFAVLMIIFVFLIFGNLRKVCRTLGILFLVEGAIGVAGFLITGRMAPNMVPAGSLPAGLDSWIVTLANDMMKPWEVFTVVMLVIGIVLMVVSFVMKKGEVSG